MGVSVDNVRGLVLALSSSIFIGSSFIVKKKGLKRAGVNGIRAAEIMESSHCFGKFGDSELILIMSRWILILTRASLVGWNAYQRYTFVVASKLDLLSNASRVIGGILGFFYMIAIKSHVRVGVILGEVANFAAYAFAPAILVTPLGALSIIVSAVLAHFMLKEKLHIFGVLGCILCVVGSISIVLHAPKEKDIESVSEIWFLATEPGFIAYFCVVLLSVAFLIVKLVPRYGQTHMVIYVGICSLMGSLTVMGVKAVAIALKLTFSGMNQFVYAQTWFFIAVVIVSCLTQMNYLNKALDTFNTAVISPVYYVMFTTLTIFASMIMFKDWDSQNASQIVTEICGFVTILSGTFLLHRTMDMGKVSPIESSPTKDSEMQSSKSNFPFID